MTLKGKAMLRAFIRSLPLTESTKVEADPNTNAVMLKGQNSSDVELAINWLRLNKAITDVSEMHKEKNLYVVIVKIATDWSEVTGLVSSKFGSFVVATPFGKRDSDE